MELVHIEPTWAATVLGLIATTQHGTTVDVDIRARLVDGAGIDGVATVALVRIFYGMYKLAFVLGQLFDRRTKKLEKEDPCALETCLVM